jgi:hypothetical protein
LLHHRGEFLGGFGHGRDRRKAVKHGEHTKKVWGFACPARTNAAEMAP